MGIIFLCVGMLLGGLHFYNQSAHQHLLDTGTRAEATVVNVIRHGTVYMPEHPQKMDLEQPLHTSGTFILVIAGGICALAGLGIIGANIHQSHRLPTSAPASE